MDSSWADVKANPKAREVAVRGFHFKEDHIPFEQELCTLKEMSWGPFTSLTQPERDALDKALREIE